MGGVCEPGQLGGANEYVHVAVTPHLLKQYNVLYGSGKYGRGGGLERGSGSGEVGGDRGEERGGSWRKAGLGLGFVVQQVGRAGGGHVSWWRQGGAAVQGVWQWWA